MKKYILTLVAAVMALGTTTANAADFEVSGGVDLVSTYTWRGLDQTGPAFQPAAAVSYGGLSLSAWGSNPFVGEGKELDVTLGYAIGSFSISLTDYWWEGESTNFLNKGLTAHQQELGLAYEFGNGLSISWNTMIAGDMDKLTVGDDGEMKASYSTYVNIAYPFTVGDVDCSASVGITPWEGAYASDFNVATVAFRMDKEFFSIPMFVEAIAAPAQKDAYLVAGMSFAF